MKPTSAKPQPTLWNRISDAVGRYPAVWSGAAALLQVGLALFFFRPYYDLNDDVFKVFFVEGVGTDQRPGDFIGYSNPLWGLFFKELFTHLPGVPWYGLALLTVQALSLWALFYAAALSRRPARTLGLGLILFWGAALPFFTGIQFTITAILAAQASFFLAWAVWRSPQNGGKAAWGAAGALAMVASLVRWDALGLTFACLIPLAWAAWRGAAPPARKKLAAHRAFLLVPALLVLSGMLYERVWYQWTPGWADFNRFDHERLELQDYRIDPYTDKNKPYFDAAGWTHNDWFMFKDWYFMDPDLYNTDKMRALASHFPRWGNQGKPASYYSLADMMRSHSVLRLLAYFPLLWLLAAARERGLLLLQMAWILAMVVLMIYMARAPDRVVLPLLLIPLNAAFLSDHGTEGKKAPRILGGVLLSAALLLAVPVVAQVGTDNRAKRGKEAAARADLARLAPRPDHLYVVWDSSFPYEAFNALDPLDEFRDFHIFSLAVYQRSPNAERTLERFHLTRPLRDLVDNPKVSLICTTREGYLYHGYMEEKYGMDIRAQKTFDGATFRVFQIHARPSRRTQGSGPAQHP